MKPLLILASASAGRASVLRRAGIPFEQRPANIDERAIEADSMREQPKSGPGELAMMLACAKAENISRNEPSALVIGADQVMECGGRFYQKPSSIEAARDQLIHLRGRAHSLNSAVCVARNGKTVWRHLGLASLDMRTFTESFLDQYIETEGEALLQSVGAYRIEGRGVQLFSRVEGDIFTIIGLPLLPLLSYLRNADWLGR